ncbi:hypothetical protein KR074_007694, partial [Drosophila pseudoananassae]
CPMERCCHCIPLWLGCLISSLLLFAVDLLERPLPYDMPCCQSLEGILFVMIRICNMVHIIGCFALFIASFVVSPNGIDPPNPCLLPFLPQGQGILVKVFLGTTSVHLAMQPVHLLTKFLLPPINWVDVGLIVLCFGGYQPTTGSGTYLFTLSLLAVLCVYIWIVALAYYRECREDVFLENETRFSRYKISTVSS